MISLMAHIWKTSPYKESMRLLELAIADRTSDNYGCYCAVDTLSKMLGLKDGRRNTQKMLRQMEGDGRLITIERIKNGGEARTSSWYILTADRPVAEVIDSISDLVDGWNGEVVFHANEYWMSIITGGGGGSGTAPSRLEDRPLAVPEPPPSGSGTARTNIYTNNNPSITDAAQAPHTQQPTRYRDLSSLSRKKGGGVARSPTPMVTDEESDMEDEGVLNQPKYVDDDDPGYYKHSKIKPQTDFQIRIAKACRLKKFLENDYEAVKALERKVAAAAVVVEDSKKAQRALPRSDVPRYHPQFVSDAIAWAISKNSTSGRSVAINFKRLLSAIENDSNFENFLDKLEKGGSSDNRNTKGNTRGNARPARIVAGMEESSNAGRVLGHSDESSGW